MGSAWDFNELGVDVRWGGEHAGGVRVIDGWLESGGLGGGAYVMEEGRERRK